MVPRNTRQTRATLPLCCDQFRRSGFRLARSPPVGCSPTGGQTDQAVLVGPQRNRGVLTVVAEGRAVLQQTMDLTRILVVGPAQGGATGLVADARLTREGVDDR